ncbi:2-dehydro-3-deoxy-6-phosphogalactonate aldolase [Chthonobacter rhizosphaerae]|uniref:2-dehydro-3-deoxy-6-phosphogalactonate aldolase n=1 Tax=Chthonobacter rhizosphaerae TaxID=2735553 RepID=UPI0015EFB058|nr:2-dehydro-3-deoxy-6-phosphogalactonate aldolase [Chthonobacter rhizosphaerae]
MSTISPLAPWPSLSRNLVAILRGIRPEEIDGVADVLLDAGFEAIEVPLNSPDALASIERLVVRAPNGILVGAGTVTMREEVELVAGVGGRLIVSPSVEEPVVRTATKLGLVTMPGVFTPTEAFAALRYGASALKFFPASVLGPRGIGAIRAVLPDGALLGAVGGITEADFPAYLAVGVEAFGLGTSLYRPGDAAADVGIRARAAVAAYDAAVRGRDA